MADKDHEYYRQRASVERSRARAAAHDKVAAVHKQLADMYDALAKKLSRQSEA
jgi:hypothetical protein